MSVNKNNKENEIKTEDGVKAANDSKIEDDKTIGNVELFYISKKYRIYFIEFLRTDYLIVICMSSVLVAKSLS